MNNNLITFLKKNPWVLPLFEKYQIWLNNTNNQVFYDFCVDDKNNGYLFYMDEKIPINIDSWKTMLELLSKVDFNIIDKSKLKIKITKKGNIKFKYKNSLFFTEAITCLPNNILKIKTNSSLFKENIDDICGYFDFIN